MEIFYLKCDSGYTTVYICPTHRTIQPQKINFNVCKLYLKSSSPPNISEHIVLADSVTMLNNLILKLNQSSTDFSVSFSSKSTYISYSYSAIKPEFAFKFSLIL